jgi:hypothetical protein
VKYCAKTCGACADASGNATVVQQYAGGSPTSIFAADGEVPVSGFDGVLAELRSEVNEVGLDGKLEDKSDTAQAQVSREEAAADEDPRWIFAVQIAVGAVGTVMLLGGVVLHRMRRHVAFASARGEAARGDSMLHLWSGDCPHRGVVQVLTPIRDLSLLPEATAI